jgi:hypothetical protein
MLLVRDTINLFLLFYCFQWGLLLATRAALCVRMAGVILFMLCAAERFKRAEGVKQLNKSIELGVSMVSIEFND